MTGSPWLVHLEADVAWTPGAFFGRADPDASTSGSSRAPDTNLRTRLFERRASRTGVGERGCAVAICESSKAEGSAFDVLLARVFGDSPALPSNRSDSRSTTIEVPSTDGLDADLRALPRPSLYCELGDAAERRRGPTGPAILHVRVEVEPHYETRFLEWYVGVHVPAILDAPGMLSARRYQRIPLARLGHESDAFRRHVALEAPGTFERLHYFTVYEMEAVDVVGREATQRCARKGACPPELEAHRAASNQVYTEVARFTSDAG